MKYNPASLAMSHLESFRAVHYRGIDGVHLERLAGVNLITGPNGAGKTSLAEAIWLFNGRFTPILPWNAHVQRSVRSVVDPVARLVRDSALELAGTEHGEVHRWRATFERMPTVGGAGTVDSDERVAPSAKPAAATGPTWPVPPQGRLRVWLNGNEAGGEHGILAEGPGEGVFILPTIDRPANHRPAVIQLPWFSMDMDEETINHFSALVAQGRKDYVKSTLRLLLPLLIDVEVITDHNGKPFILATTTEDERLPLQSLGGGMTRLFRLFVAFHRYKGGLVVIDEIENGLHHLVLPKLWRQVQAMTGEFDVQIFATTHSRECIDAALDTFMDDHDQLAVHALSRHGDKVRAVTYCGETLEAARDINLDLR